MSTAPATEPMSGEQGAVLADFARACKAAARSVSLYPGTHPAIRAALSRVAVGDQPPDRRRRRHAHRPSGHAGHRRPRAGTSGSGDTPSWRRCSTTGWSASCASSGMSMPTTGGRSCCCSARAGGPDRRGRHRPGLGGHRARPLRDPGNRLRRGAARARRRRRRRLGPHHRVLPAGRIGDARRRAIESLVEAVGDPTRFGELLDRLQRAPAASGASIGARAAALLQLLQTAVDAAKASGAAAADAVLQTIADSSRAAHPGDAAGCAGAADVAATRKKPRWPLPSSIA